MAYLVANWGYSRSLRNFIPDFPKLAQFIIGMPDPKVLIQHLVLQGRYAAVEAKGIGKFKNGKDYNNRYAFFLEIRDDKVIALREYMDSYYVSTL